MDLESKLASLDDDNIDSKLSLLRDSPNYEKIKSKLITLTPEQQKSALDYALKAHQKAKQLKISAVTQVNSSTIVTPTGTTFTTVPLNSNINLNDPLKNVENGIKKKLNDVEVIHEAQIIDSEMLDSIKEGSLEKLMTSLNKFKKDLFFHPSTKGNSSNRKTNLMEVQEECHSLLHWAALEGQATIVEYLCMEYTSMKRPDYIDNNNERGETPLHWACIRGHVKVVNVLLQRGANVFLADASGYTSLHHASQFGHTIVVAQLLRWIVRNRHHGHLTDSLVDVKDGCSRTPLHWAAYKGHCFTAEFLIKKGASVLAKDWEDCTPLHWAAMQGDVDMVQRIITTGFDLNISNLPEKNLADELLKFLNMKESSGKVALELCENKSERFHPLSTDGHRYLRTIASLKTASKIAKRGYVPKRGFFAPFNLEFIIHDEQFTHPSYYVWPFFGLFGGFIYFYFIFSLVYVYTPMVFMTMISCYIALWGVWLILQVKDPGFVVCDAVDGDQELSKFKRFFNYLMPCYYPPRGKIKRNEVKNFHDFQHEHEVELELLESESLWKKKYDEIFPSVSLPANVENKKFRELYFEVLDKGLNIPVCTTCEIAKPLRSKHDRVSNKCISRFDHFCPWVGISIGANNHGEFLVFCSSLAVVTACFLYSNLIFLTKYNEQQSIVDNFIEGQMWYVPFLIIPAMFGFIYGLLMTVQHLYLVTRNLTTNEMMNFYKYRYLQLNEGRILNPFSRSIKKNWMEFFGLVDPVKVNLQIYHEKAFNEQTESRKKIVELKENYGLLEARSDKKPESLLSITTTSKITANDINMSMLPTMARPKQK